MERTSHPPQPPAVSWWEMEAYLRPTDVVVIGAGIVGLCTAIRCKELNPKMDVLVLERGALPSGASTKNAGFACFGSLTELAADLENHPEEEVFGLARRRLEGLSLLRGMLGDGAIGYRPCGGDELFAEQDSMAFARAMALLPEANALMASATGMQETYAQDQGRMARNGLSGIRHLIHNRAEGAIDTGRMMLALTEKAQRMGVRILCGAGVRSVVGTGAKAEIALDNGAVIRTRHAHVATNGFAGQLLDIPDLRPGRAQVLITEPIEGLRLDGTFHMHEGYYYFRNVGNRVLIGGGRHLDPRGETTHGLGLTEQIQQSIEELLSRHVLAGRAYRVAHRWAGIMGLGGSKQPIVREIAPGISCAVRMGGMGIALGAAVGREGAELVCRQ